MVALDFGSGVFQGEARWLEVAVRPGSSDGSYTILSPRQALTAAPYALYSLGAPWSGLTGVPAGFTDGVDNDTTYSAGTGLTLSGNTFSVDFAGSGSATTVARSDHDHWGASWSGSGTGLMLFGGSIGLNASGINYGVFGWSSYPNGVGVYGRTTAPSGYAGYFYGDVEVIGRLDKLAGGFKIDHPLDPENKYLNHSFVESPDMMNIYNGNVELDANGEAWVELPEWFEALNRDFRYQLTPIGQWAPLYIAEEIQNNRFKIAGGVPGMKVSWQVTGIRHDPYAEAYRIPVEEEKPTEERGTYLYPEGYGQPKEKGLDYQRNIDLIEGRSLLTEDER